MLCLIIITRRKYKSLPQCKKVVTAKIYKMSCNSQILKIFIIMIFTVFYLLELFCVVIFYMSIHFIELCFVFLKGTYTLKRRYFKNAFFHLQPFCTEVAKYIIHFVVIYSWFKCLYIQSHFFPVQHSNLYHDLIYIS